MARKKKGKQPTRVLERVYLILTLVAVAGVAIFLGYVVGQYAIQAATGALNRELIQAGEEVRQLEAQEAEAPSQRNLQKSEPATRADAGKDGSGPASDTSPSSHMVAEPKTPPPAVSPAPSKQLYRVQVGAFSSEANARGLADELISKGYQALVIPGSLHRVQVGAFSQRENAETLKRELEGKGYPAVIISGE